MIIYTICPSCGKNINADLRHKEVVVHADAPKLAAIIQCEYCRDKLGVHMSLVSHTSVILQWSESAA